MKMLYLLILAAISISLMGCSALRGNVIPTTGPSMEQIYDDMGKNKETSKKVKVGQNEEALAEEDNDESDLDTIRRNYHYSLTVNSNRYAVLNEFHKLPNPELVLYIYPHLAGADQLPVPGYYTAFNVYPHGYYALPQERVRG